MIRTISIILDLIKEVLIFTNRIYGVLMSEDSDSTNEVKNNWYTENIFNTPVFDIFPPVFL